MDNTGALGPINGVLIWTDEAGYPALAGFYRDTLQLPVRTDRGHHLAFAWPSGMRLTLGVHSAIESGPARDPRRVMVNFEVRDINAAQARLSERGVDFLRPASQEPWGGWIATFVDPDGNLLQLLQSAP